MPSLRAETIHPVFTPKNISLLADFIKIRYQEVLEFEAYKVDMKDLVKYCIKFNQIHVAQYENQLATLERDGKKIDDYILKSVCSILEYSSNKNGNCFIFFFDSLGHVSIDFASQGRFNKMKVKKLKYSLFEILIKLNLPPPPQDSQLETFFRYLLT